MLKSDNKVVIKHSAAVQVSNNMTLFQRKAWNVLLANAYDRLPKQDTFEVSIRDLADVLKFDSKNLKFLKDNIKQMIGCVVEWDLLEKTGDWEAYGLLSSAKIVSGNVLQYSYNSELKKKLFNPKTYAKIGLRMQSMFKKKHSLALYELCVDFYIEKFVRGETPWISVEDFKKLMGVANEKHYVDFKNLGRDLIRVSVEEINSISDLFVQVAYQRTARTISAIKFKITPNPNENNLLHKLTVVDEATRQSDLPFEETDHMAFLRQRMAEYGISEKVIDDLIHEKKGDTELIEAALDNVDIKIRANKIRDTVAGYAVEVIRSFNPEKGLKEKLIAQEKVASEKIAQAAKEQENLRMKIDSDYFEYRTRIVMNHMESLTEQKRKTVLEIFEDGLNNTQRNMYKDGGLERASMRQLFNQHIIDRYLAGKVESKEKFSAKYQPE